MSEFARDVLRRERLAIKSISMGRRVEFVFEEGAEKGTTTSGEGTFALSACDLRLLRLRLKKKRARRIEMKTSPPLTPPMIASVLGFL